MAATTNTLKKRIIQSKSFQEYVEQNRQSFEKRSICEYLKDLCRERSLVPEQVIRAAQIDRTYGHQLFNGTRKPSRDKLLQLSFGFSLSLEETQTLLQLAGKSPLYARIKRDAACIFVISHKKSILELQYLLSQLQLPLLGEA